MERQAWPNAPDLLALRLARPERYPALFRSSGETGWDILFALPMEDRVLPRAADGHALRRFLAGLPQPASNTFTSAEAASFLPFRGGWLLALSYELGGLLEPGVGVPDDEEDFPLAWAQRIPAAVLIDRQRQQTWLMAETSAQLAQLQADLQQCPDANDQPLPELQISEEIPSRFLEGVARIKEYIRDGDVFQVNLSRAWRAESVTPISASNLFRKLSQTNPAPFSAVVDMQSWAIVSSSPERLVSLDSNAHVLTRPIAGTHPRSSNVNEDEALKGRLAAHPKERAEHIMLVDLERNDLGRICQPGSVRVEALMELATYAHVHHLESSVSGNLSPGVGLYDLVRAVFPGGTITGCPKIRTMQIIRELEGTPRRAYTGSLGYVNHDGTLDLNILIRTFLIKGHTAWFRTGAGIVADSEPERELSETRAKAMGLLRALGV